VTVRGKALSIAGGGSHEDRRKGRGLASGINGMRAWVQSGRSERHVETTGTKEGGGRRGAMAGTAEGETGRKPDPPFAAVSA
jgi:hypothetical protein